MTLTEFLLARYTEDEAAMSGEYVDQWHRTPCGYWIWEDDAACDCGVPSRVLAECEAKRRIVGRCGSVDYAMPSTHLAHGILGLLALPYADHPDYDEEWRP